MKALSLLLLIFLSSTVSVSQSTIDRLNAEASELFRAGKPDDALKKSQEALALDSLNADAARFTQDLRKLPPSYYGQLVDLHPSVPLYHYLYARAIRSERKPDSVRYHLQRSIELDSTFYWGYIGLVSVWINSKDRVDESWALLERARALRPQAQQVFNYHGILLIASGKAQEALPYCYEMIRREPTTEMFGYLDRAHKSILSPEAGAQHPHADVLRGLVDSVMALWTISPRPASMLMALLSKDSAYSSIRSMFEVRIRGMQKEDDTRREQAFRERVEARNSMLPEGVSQEAASLLAKSRAAAESIRSYYDESVSTIQLTGTRPFRDERSQIRAAARPRDYRIERRDKGGNPVLYVIRKDSTLWQVRPAQRQFIRKNVSVTSGAVEIEPNPVLASLEKFGDDPERASVLRTEDVFVGGKKLHCDVLAVRPRPAANQGRALRDAIVTYWIDRESHLSVRDSSHTLALMSDGSVADAYETTVIKVRSVNAALPDTMFAFQPPPEWKEVERFGSAPTAELKGKPAPSFSLPDLTGATHRLEQYKGKVVLLDFWATWCGPCRIELPRVQKLFEELGGKGLIVLGINNEAKELPTVYVKQNKYTFPTLLDVGSAIGREYTISAIPTVVIINKEGIVSNIFVGVRPEEELRSAVLAAGL